MSGNCAISDKRLDDSWRKWTASLSVEEKADPGIVVKKPAGEVINRAIEEGLLIISAKGNVLRFVPSLIIEKEHIDEMIEKLKRALL